MLVVPDHIAELAEDSCDSNFDFNSRVFRIALWFVGHGLTEDEYVDYVSTAGIGISYKRNDLLRRLAKTYLDAEDKYDPALAGGVVRPGFADEMTELLESIRADPKQPNKTVVLALVQHSINTGHNPVNASARQLAAISGKTVPATARAMNRLASSRGGGVLHGVTYDGQYGHSRLWHLDPCYRRLEGYICTCKYISNPPAKPDETRFLGLVEPMAPGTEVTVTLIASALSITRPAARKLLDKHLDSHFAGGFFPGDRRTKSPAKWWRARPDGRHHDYRGP